MIPGMKEDLDFIDGITSEVLGNVTRAIVAVQTAIADDNPRRLRRAARELAEARVALLTVRRNHVLPLLDRVGGPREDWAAGGAS